MITSIEVQRHIDARANKHPLFSTQYLSFVGSSLFLLLLLLLFLFGLVQQLCFFFLFVCSMMRSLCSLLLAVLCVTSRVCSSDASSFRRFRTFLEKQTGGECVQLSTIRRFRKLAGHFEGTSGLPHSVPSCRVTCMHACGGLMS